jgi:hypothetical protein
MSSPEAAAEQLEIIFFGVVLDRHKSVASRSLVVRLLGRITALIRVSHLVPGRDAEVSWA